MRRKYRKRIDVRVSLSLSLETDAWLRREAMKLAAKPPFDTYDRQDVIRMALEHYRKTAAVAPKVVKPCRLVQNFGMNKCLTCKQMWFTEEGVPAPECPGLDKESK